MSTWHIMIEFSADDDIRAAVEAGTLGFRPPQWKSTTTGQRITISETVKADECKALFAASWQAVERLRKHLHTTAKPLSVTIYSEGETEPSPDLVGLTEAAARLGVTRQRALQLSKTRAFPRPLAQLAAGPVFSRREIDNFGARRDARNGKFTDQGRPAARAHLTPDRR